MVWLLLALTAATAVFGWVNRPETTVPQPGPSNIEVDFSQGHPAVAPVTVSVLLSRDDFTSGDGGGITMTIDLQGQDLARAGWSVSAVVPSGVTWPYPGSGISSYTSQGTSYVAAAPGPQASGEYELDLEWTDLRSGPLEVTGATMTAVLPHVAVIDDTAREDEQVPPAQVTVNEALEPGTDFTYQSGPPPGQITGYEWQWQPLTGTINGPTLNTEFTVEAKSAMLDGEGQVTEFYSGIAFGIAAAAAVAAAVEFVKAKRAARRRRRRGRPHSRPATYSRSTGGTAKSAARTRRSSAAVDAAKARVWAKGQGIELKARGRVPADVVEQYKTATRRLNDAPRKLDRPTLPTT